MTIIFNVYAVIGLMFFSAVLLKLSVNVFKKLVLVLLLAAVVMYFDKPDWFVSLISQVRMALNS